MTSLALPARLAFAAVQRGLGTVALSILSVLVILAGVRWLSGQTPESYGTAPLALAIHVGTVIPALFLGAAVLLMRKGTRLHRVLGRIWGSLMMVTSLASFWLQGFIGTIGPIHILSAITLYSIPRAIYCARTGDLEGHRRAMTGPYIGLVLAGLFAFLPGRVLGQIAFGGW